MYLFTLYPGRSSVPLLFPVSLACHNSPNPSSPSPSMVITCPGASCLIRTTNISLHTLEVKPGSPGRRKGSKGRHVLIQLFVYNNIDPYLFILSCKLKFIIIMFFLFRLSQFWEFLPCMYSVDTLLNLFLNYFLIYVLNLQLKTIWSSFLYVV